MNKVLKSTLGVVASVATIATTVAPAVNVAAWGNSGTLRDTYTIAQINSGVVDDKIIFNSIVDSNENLSEENKNAGVIVPLSDERNFVGARDASTGNNGKNNVVLLMDIAYIDFAAPEAREMFKMFNNNKL